MKKIYKVIVLVAFMILITYSGEAKAAAITECTACSGGMRDTRYNSDVPAIRFNAWVQQEDGSFKLVKDCKAAHLHFKWHSTYDSYSIPLVNGYNYVGYLISDVSILGNNGSYTKEFNPNINMFSSVYCTVGQFSYSNSVKELSFYPFNSERWNQIENDFGLTTDNYETLVFNLLYMTAGTKTYTVNFDSTELDYEIDSMEFNIANPTINLPVPKKEGHRFVGWKVSTTGTVSSFHAGDLLTEIKTGSYGDITVTPEFELAEYSITYVLNGGVNNQNNVSTFTMADSVDKFFAPAKDYYVFEGWYSDSAYRNKVTGISEGTTGDITLYAKWSPVDYSISYVLDGGVNNSGNPNTYNLDNTIEFKNPDKSGYTFAGWFTDSEYISEVTSTKGLSGNITLYAKFELTPTEEPTEEPTEKPTESSTETPTEASTEESTEKPVESSTEKEVPPATEKNTPTSQAGNNTTSAAGSSSGETSATVIKNTKVKSAKNVKGKKLKIKLKKVTGCSYQIKISTTKKFTKNVNTYTTSKTTYTIKKLKKGKTYYVKVRPYKKVAGKKVYGKWTNAKKVKIRK